MAENKKGFVLYADVWKTVSKLPNEKAGELFKHLLMYVNDEDPQTDDILIEIAFEPIKQQLKRDLEKWETIKGKRSDAGKKSAELRKLKSEQKATNPTSVESVEQDSTNPTVNDNVNVTVNVNDTVKVKDNVIKNNIIERENKFRLQSKEFNQYDSKMIDEFCDYWTEPTPSGKKMLYETNRTFDIKRRLQRWNTNNFNKFNNGKSTTNNQPKLSTEQVYQLNYEQNAKRDRDFIRSEQAKRKAARDERGNRGTIN